MSFVLLGRLRNFPRMAPPIAGDSAQLAFLELRTKSLTSARRQVLIRDLLDYRRRDTWAMVVLRGFLRGEPLNLAQALMAA